MKKKKKKKLLIHGFFTVTFLNNLKQETFVSYTFLFFFFHSLSHLILFKKKKNYTKIPKYTQYILGFSYNTWTFSIFGLFLVHISDFCVQIIRSLLISLNLCGWPLVDFSPFKCQPQIVVTCSGWHLFLTTEWHGLQQA